jgi:DNA-binding NarL/FixJ family response regulator
MVGDKLPNACAADVVVADFDNGIKLAASVEQLAPVMIVSEEDGEAATREAFESGVSGYLQSCSSIDSIVNGVRIIANGGVVIDPVVASRVMSDLNAERLTKRELAVLSLLVQGMTDKAIATRLGNAVGTIKCHLKQLRGKLKASSRSEAIVIAQRRGLLPREFQRRRVPSVSPAQFKLKRPTAGAKSLGPLPVVSRRTAAPGQHAEL